MKTIAPPPAPDGQDEEPDQREKEGTVSDGPVHAVAVARADRDEEERGSDQHRDHVRGSCAPERRTARDLQPVGEARERGRNGDDEYQINASVQP